MLKTHPSMLLMLDIDERLDTHDLRLEINRCYAYVGSPVIRTHAPEDADAPVVNTMRIIVQLGTRHYIDSSVEGADELWEGTLKDYLRNQFHKLANQMMIFNRRQREESNPELIFTYLETNLENGKLVCRMHLDSTCVIPESESAWLGRVRQAYNEGVLGEGVVNVTLPSPESYDLQYKEGMIAKAEREAARKAAEEAERAAKEAEQAAAEDVAEAGFMESPELLNEAKLADAAEAASHDVVMKAQVEEVLDKPDNEKTAEEIVADRIAEEAHLHELMEKKYAVPEADFALNYSVWQINYEDGTSKTYDWNARESVEEA